MANSNALTAFGGGAGLISREQMGSFLNSAAMSAPTGVGGKQFLKLDDKDGTWLYGQEETVVEDGSRWAINPLSLFHGYIAWHEAKVEGEHRQPINRPLVASETLAGVKAQKGWETQYGFDIVCTEGEDQGTLLEYKTSSAGGKKAFGDVVIAMNAQYEIDPDRIVPVVELASESYFNKKWKRDVWNPVFRVVGWASLTGAAAPAAEEDDEAASPTPPKAEPAAAPRQRTAAKATPAPAPDPAEEEEALAREYEQAAAETQAPRRRLRR